MTRLNSTNKYHNIKCERDGIAFDSKAERERYDELKLLKQSCDIRWFNRQPSFVLYVDRYRPDFIVCGKDGKIWVEDVKGFATQEFKRKQKEWAQLYPDIELRVLKRGTTARNSRESM